MLKAILHGKAGRIEHNKDDSVSWSQLFKAREDLLTSTIFERFAYLSDEVQRTLLDHWFKLHHGFIPESFGEFLDITYWQRFSHEHDEGTNQVEPDLILHFDQCDIIVEVKPPAGGNQYFGQWYKEIESFLQAEEDSHKSLYFLAIGRIEQADAARWAKRLLSKQQQLKGIAALKWDAVTTQLLQLLGEQSECELSKQDARIIQDMLDGLSLYGQQTSPFKWAELTHSNFPNLSLNHPLLRTEVNPITEQEDDSSTELEELTQAFTSLDLPRFQSALKEQ
ncbi:hypothetical protein [Photobacterium gaetbulicola]|uniref:hypothetical protein n=1 Tax=Photobacterium gaetbulicola TaxID=1295392 RepID=UPI00068B9259|nr:hypothetical protein [Photobacterium gaetbulicola]